MLIRERESTPVSTRALYLRVTLSLGTKKIIITEGTSVSLYPHTTTLPVGHLGSLGTRGWRRPSPSRR